MRVLSTEYVCTCVVCMCGSQTENIYFLSNAQRIFLKIGYILDHKENLSKSQKGVFRPSSLTTIPERRGNILKGISGYICIIPGEGDRGCLAQRADVLLLCEMLLRMP